MISFYTISIILFVLLIACIVYKGRKKITRDSVVLLRRTERGKKFLTNIGKRFPRFWMTLGTIGVVVGFYFSITTFIQMVQLTISNIAAGGTLPGVGLVLPSLSSQTIIAPGLIAPPFWHWIISIALLIMIHEGFHGIMTTAQGMRIKNLGLVLFIIIPGAFVEPDEEQLQKQSSMKQLRVYAAGSFANFILAFGALLISVLLITNFYTPAGVTYNGVFAGFPAEQANLTGTIIEIDNQTIADTNDLARVLGSIQPGTTINIMTRDGENINTFTLTTTNNPNNISGSFIGISRPASYQAVISEYSSFNDSFEFIRTLLYFIFLINFGVGAFNLMPLWITDGARMWEIVFKKVSKKRYKTFLKIFSYITLLLILMNLFMSITSGFI